LLVGVNVIVTVQVAFAFSVPPPHAEAVNGPELGTVTVTGTLLKLVMVKVALVGAAGATVAVPSANWVALR
jgi:hypothetical protein